MSREILVYADWDAVDHGPCLMGTLRASVSRGNEIFSFSYDSKWLSGTDLQTLDPALQLFQGSQYLSDERTNFGLFLDSSPDRWGKVLMERREAVAASSEGRERRPLLESDYLLGVHDGQRMGGLRFKLEESGPFLDDNAKSAAPPSTSLRELENASWKVQDVNSDASEVSKWLSMLIAPGSSLGGARPKAGVQYPNGDLWIAKFPGRNDKRDMGAWEWVVWQLGKDAGLDLPLSQFLDIGSNNHRTFAVRRFDRINGARRRLHFASAMTLLGQTDGDDHHSGVSYLDLCDFISNHGAHPERDLQELWRRIVFSMFVSNTDDHLRNHGFLLEQKGWVLSPAYDINAEPTGPNTGLKLNVNEADNRLEPDLALEVAEFFRVKIETAKKTVEDIRNIVSQWQSLAKKAGIGRGEMELMEPAFHLCETGPISSPPSSKDHWIAKSGKRHNSACRYFKKGSGSMGTKIEGKACGLCGG